ncbi:MAG: transcription antitermination factor NusB [Clostridia bacterium]|nr:transcription antitermination factor NusB [Clostridia bacterium]
MAESRVKERERVFRLLFSAEFQKGTSPEELLESFLEAEELAGVSDYVRDTFFGAHAFSEESLSLAVAASRGWTAERMSPAMRALLKLALYEILKTEIATSIAVNEAVELCKRYEDARGAKFLNGILGTVSRNHMENKSEEA